MQATIRATERGDEEAMPSRLADDLVFMLLDHARALVTEDPSAALSSLLQLVGLLRERCSPAAELLTPAEHRVVLLAVGGTPNREIAERLFLSVRTVESHLSHAYAKLGVRTKAELAAWWAIEGDVDWRSRDPRGHPDAARCSEPRPRARPAS